MMRRALRNAGLSALGMVVVYGLVWLWDTALRDSRFLDGWILCAGLALQFLFHMRKRRSVLPVGDATVWLQAHIYMGYLVIVVFGFHTGLSLPDTGFEWVIWSVFVTVAAAGMLGAFLTKSIPAKLDYSHDRSKRKSIPGYRQLLAQEVEVLAGQCETPAGLQSISDLYINTLNRFFQRPRNFLAHLKHSRRPIELICEEIDDVERYLGMSGGNALQRIRDLVVAKDKLDFQYTHTTVLQVWLFVHVPAAYMLIVFVIGHVVVIYAFSSGVP